MREIKFRAWDKRERNWIKVACLQLDEDGTFLGVSTTHTLAWHEVELSQYTGLKDKNGKEIYEGDIVRVNCGDLKRNGWGVVEWRPSGCCFGISGWLDEPYIDQYHKRQKGELYFDLQEWLHTEAIGNIWENKELLK